MKDDEQWKSVPSLEDSYEVSSYGRVRSKDRFVRNSNGGQKLLKSQIIKAHPVYKGYLVVKLRKSGETVRFLVSRLVLSAFDRLPADREHACHGNGDHQDNRLENLRWDTPKNNEADKVIHGTTNRGDRNGCAVLSSEQVTTILSSLQRGKTGRSLAKEYGVAETTISAIKTGRSWGSTIDAMRF